MRYRKINGLDDFSRDVAAVIDFLGESEFRHALKKIGDNLNSKGFVTPFDDALFALELDLLNIERLRTQCSGKFALLPARCHAGVDFLLGLGQTIPVLSDHGKTILLGRVRKGLDEGLWPLRHELAVAANLSKRGWDIEFHDFEHGGGFDYLITKDHMTFEVEAKAMSVFTGWPIKPGTLNNLLVEIKQHFVWSEPSTIPFLGTTLPSNLPSHREHLQQLVAALSSAAQTKTIAETSGTQVQFIGVVPDMPADKLMLASRVHSAMRRKIVLVNLDHPKLILELDSKKPVQIHCKLIRMIKETAEEQFSGTRPAVIWTHLNFISEMAFSAITKRTEKASLFDAVANGTLMSEKRNHLSQLVFSGGSVLQKEADVARSASRTVIYNSPICRFGNDVIFEGGRTHPDHKAA